MGHSDKQQRRATAAGKGSSLARGNLRGWAILAGLIVAGGAGLAAGESSSDIVMQISQVQKNKEAQKLFYI
jgi:hypothetical protein